VTDDLQNRESERRGLLIVWALMVAAVNLASLHRFGEFSLQSPQSVEAWLGWFFMVSPLIPLVLWLRARKQLRECVLANKPVEKPE
jgi:hypothetical protein